MESTKIFGEFSCVADLNETAINLRKNGEIEEVKTLAKENHISEEQTDEFIKGNRLFLADSLYVEPKEEPKEEVTESYSDKEEEPKKDEPKEEPEPVFEKGIDKFKYQLEKGAGKDAGILNQWKPIIAYIEERCSEDKHYEQTLLLPHKNINRMYKYMADKARELVKGVKGCFSGGVCVEGETVLGWIDEYILQFDDLKEIEEKKKQEEERKRKAEEAKKKKKATKKSTSKTTKTATPVSKPETAETKATETKPEAIETEVKKEETEVPFDEPTTVTPKVVKEVVKPVVKSEPGQLSLFDLFM